MGRIRQLDTQIANMIAAGEVVERPQGVVKELVENAIDAGATRITVNVEEGGLSRIAVYDDGCGMDSEDAVLSLQRHATSKIRTQADLFDIHTLGFRGEALPSIAAVSKLTLNTSDGKESTQVKMAYGKVESVSAYACNQGTEIIVEGLFYKTPARLKHMKSGAYENSLIQDVIVRFAMSHPEIAFTFVSSGKEAFRTSGQGNLLEVIFQAWGREAAENAIPVEFEDYDYKVTGYIIKPLVTRSSRNFMHVFLNGRMVRTFRLYKAIQDGYEDFIVKGRNPMAVLQVQMDPPLLDVNVHPSKWEVRISKENQLEYLIRDNIRNTLKNNVLAPHTQVREVRTVYEPISFNTEELERKDSYVAHTPEKKPEKPKTEPAAPQTEPAVPEKKSETPARHFPYMHVIGQLHGKYILCSCDEGLAVLDQHAFQERVHYEEIAAVLNTEPAMTELLLPITILAGNDLVQRLDELNDACQDLHLVFESFGHDTLILRQIPVWMKEVNEEAFLQDVLENFRNDTENKYRRLEKKKIATMACHHSIRFNRRLTPEEMQEVVNQLSRCENPYHCPHGRPTFIILSEKELEKEFLR